MKQLDIFDLEYSRKAMDELWDNPPKCPYNPPETAPYQPHSETSKAAAVRIEPSMKTMQGKVLAYLRENGPCTDEEMQVRIPMSASTQRPRRIELVKKGLVRPARLRREALTRSGRWAQLWEAV